MRSPWDSAPRYLLRDRHRIFGDDFTRQVHDMGMEQVLCAPRSPWHRAYIERVIGTIRRECLDHVIIFNEAALYRQVKSFAAYYTTALHTTPPFYVVEKSRMA